MCLSHLGDRFVARRILGAASEESGVADPLTLLHLLLDTRTGFDLALIARVQVVDR